MKQFLITLLITAMGTSVFAEISPAPKEVVISIDYISNQFMINEQEFGAGNTVEEVVAILGNYDRIKVEEGFSNYFFDAYGIMLIENKNTNQLHGLMIQFTKQETEFSTERTFSGKLFVNTKKVNPYKGMGFMERLLKDLNPRNTKGFKLTGATEQIKADYIYKPGGSLQLIFINFN